MDTETLHCNSCHTTFTILWHQEDDEYMMTPSFCPNCGAPLTGDEESYTEEYE